MAGAHELLWAECYALAAENYNIGQESQPNGLILLIQPKGLHTAALSFTAREEDSLKGRGEREAEWGTVGGSWIGPDSKTQRVVFLKRKGEEEGKKTQLRLILDIKLFWAVSNHTKSLRVVFFE